MYLELELITLDRLDLRHAPLFIKEEPGCNTNTKAVITPREKLQDKLVSDGKETNSEERRWNTIQMCVHETFLFDTLRKQLDGRRSPILNRDDATRYRSACMRLSYLVQDRLDLAETAKHLAQRMSEPREFDFVPLKLAARYLVEKAQSSAGISKTETC